MLCEPCEPCELLLLDNKKNKKKYLSHAYPNLFLGAKKDRNSSQGSHGSRDFDFYSIFSGERYWR